MTTVAGSTATTASLTTSGMLTTGSCFAPQLASFLSPLWVERVLFTLGRWKNLFYLLTPATEHFTDFNKRWGNSQIFLGIEHLQFPGELQKKFEQIQLAAGAQDIRLFLSSGCIACEDDDFYRFEKKHVDFCADCVSTYARDMRQECMPQLVRISCFLQDGKIGELRWGGARLGGSDAYSTDSYL